MGSCLFLKEKRKGAKRHISWLYAHLSFTQEGLGLNVPPHCSQTGLFFLLDVLCVPRSKSLLSLCSPPQMLSLPNPLVSASSSRHLANFCTYPKLSFLLLRESMHSSIYSFCIHSSTSVLLGGRHFERQ